MKRLKVGINGFGRIGRAFTRIALDRNSFDIVAINTRKTSSKMLAYMLQYDSIYRKYHKTVKSTDDSLIIDNIAIRTTQADKPEEIPWDDIDLVIDATGAFTKHKDLAKHFKGKVRRVIVTTPPKDDEIPVIVLGVNDNKFNWELEQIISNASCTTNCTAPMFKVIDDSFHILTGFLTTAHAYTQSQSLTDDPNKTFDRSRAAPLNIVPSTTGAATAVIKVLPQLDGKIDGMAIRVPIATGSYSDITAVVEHKTTVEEVNNKFKEAANTYLKNILSFETESLVSSDCIGSPYSCILDAPSTKVIRGHLIKVFGWYDNEWGYSSRLVDLVEKLALYL